MKKIVSVKPEELLQVFFTTIQGIDGVAQQRIVDFDLPHMYAAEIEYIVGHFTFDDPSDLFSADHDGQVGVSIWDDKAKPADSQAEFGAEDLIAQFEWQYASDISTGLSHVSHGIHKRDFRPDHMDLLAIRPISITAEDFGASPVPNGVDFNIEIGWKLVKLTKSSFTDLLLTNS